MVLAGDGGLSEVHHDSELERARREAFGWYTGDPPSPDEARRHFEAKVRGDPANLDLYADALGIFLATWWNAHPSGKQQG